MRGWQCSQARPQSWLALLHDILGIPSALIAPVRSLKPDLFSRVCRGPELREQFLFVLPQTRPHYLSGAVACLVGCALKAIAPADPYPGRLISVASSWKSPCLSIPGCRSSGSCLKGDPQEASPPAWRNGRRAEASHVPPQLSDVRAWNQCEHLLPHVLALANLPAQVADLAQAEVLQKAANYLLERARYELARSLYLQALQMREQIEGSEHPDLVQLLYRLARLFYEQGEIFLKRALHIIGQHSSSEHSEMFYPLNGLALIIGGRGNMLRANHS
jgi:hypothetical protein